jgi:hypothetical protein
MMNNPKEGCGKEIYFDAYAINGTYKSCPTRCGWFCDGERRYCAECEKLIKEAESEVKDEKES